MSTTPEAEQPIQPQYVGQMNALGRVIDEIFNPDPDNKQTAFALFLFPFGAGDDHRSNYISNSNREDMIATLKEFIARAEGTYVEPSGGTA